MKEITGNLVLLAKEGQFDIIIQGCNCFCTMGKGLAKDIKESFPPAYEADQATKKGDRAKLGTYSFANCINPDGSKVMVVNAYTQYNYASSANFIKKDLFDYAAFTRILQSLNKQFPGARIGVPQIGSGLAGGNWDKIKTIVERELVGMDVHIVYFGVSNKFTPIEKIDEVQVKTEIANKTASSEATTSENAAPGSVRNYNRFTFKTGRS